MAKSKGGKNAARKVSLAEIAKRAGVSKMTASRVIRGGTGFSEKTRVRVLKVSNEMGYVPNRIAAALGSESANTLIGIALPTLSRDLYGPILEGLERKLSAIGYQPIVGVVGYEDSTELAWLNSALSWRPGGMVVAGRERSEKNREFLRSLTMPVVEIWSLGDTQNKQEIGDPLQVGFDHYAAGYEMGEYIASRYSGRIGYVGVQFDNMSLGADRLRGFRTALLDHGDKDRTDIVTLELKDKSSFYSGYYGTEQILSGNPELRMLYYVDDNMAVGGMMLCQKKGLRIPGHIAIAGFGGLDIGSVLPTRLTTTNAYQLRIGKLAAENLIKAINGAPVSTSEDVGFKLVRGQTA